MQAVWSESQVLFAKSRITHNVFNRALVATILLVVLAPFVLVLSFIITAAMTETAKAGAQVMAGVASIQHRGHGGKGFASQKTSLVPDGKLIMKLMPWTVQFLSAGIAILLWGMSSATAGNLLARSGARPAKPGRPGGNAVQALAALSARAGVPPPKLYVIHCSFPTVFSDASDSRHTMVAITTGTLELLGDRELEALLAHEVSHIVNRDGRLEAVLASLATLTEYPARMFQRKSPQMDGRVGFTRNLALLEVILSPLSLYVFFVSPLMTALIRSMVLRRLEYYADVQAARLTGDPEALAGALAKIGGVGTVLGSLTFSSLPAHHSLALRIERLMNRYKEFGFHGIDTAIAKGKQFAKERPGLGQEQFVLTGSASQLAGHSQGLLTGRVYQVMSRQPVPVYDRPGPGALVRKRIEPGALVVAFDAQGKTRQVNTAQEVFGYVSRDVRLRVVEGVLPQEVYDPESRAAVEERLRREGRVGTEPASVAEWMGLSNRQACMALGFGASVFVGTMVLLFLFAGR
jgi:heat shock protein HtpX